jgi:hypothetical protein
MFFKLDYLDIIKIKRTMGFRGFYIMDRGEIIFAKKHVDFLNKLIRKDFQGYRKNTYPYINGLDIWFIRLDGRESKEGWTNTLKTDGKIFEEYTGDPENRLISHRFFPTKKRAIFNIDEDDNGRKYIFMGVFKVEGNNDRRVWQKVLDSYPFPSTNEA